MGKLKINDDVKIITYYERYGIIVDMSDYLYFVLFHDNHSVEPVLKTDTCLKEGS